MAKKTNEEPISGLSLAEALSTLSPPRLSLDVSGKKVQLTYEINGEQVKRNLDEILEEMKERNPQTYEILAAQDPLKALQSQPQLSLEISGEKVLLTYEISGEKTQLNYDEMLEEQPQLSDEKFARQALLKAIFFEIAPIPNISKFTIPNCPKKSFHILDDKLIVASVELAFAQKTNKLLNFKQINMVINPSKPQNNYLDLCIFAYCRITKKVNNPIIKDRVKKASENNGTEFFIRLGEELSQDKDNKIGCIENIMIWGWPMSIHQGIPPLCQFSHQALFKFFQTTVAPYCTFEMIKKVRIRLRLIKSRNNRVTVKDGELTFS